MAIDFSDRTVFVFENITRFCRIRYGGGAGRPPPTNNFRLMKLTPTNYGMFHVTWTTLKFNRKQLGTVSAYVM